MDGGQPGGGWRGGGLERVESGGGGLRDDAESRGLEERK